MWEVEWRRSDRRILLPIVVLRPGNPYDLTRCPATALLDTGATVSGIGPGPIKALGLESYGKKQLKSATEMRFVEYFLFRLGFEQESQAASQPFIFEELDGFSWSSPADFDVILGMDILSRCDFQMQRDSNCRLTFG